MLASVPGTGVLMRKYVIVALIALATSPAVASTERGGSPRPAGKAVDILYPEIAVDDEGWRGLLPVILINTEEVADQPKPAPNPGKRSERIEAR